MLLYAPSETIFAYSTKIRADVIVQCGHTVFHMFYSLKQKSRLLLATVCVWMCVVATFEANANVLQIEIRNCIFILKKCISRNLKKVYPDREMRYESLVQFCRIKTDTQNKLVLNNLFLKYAVSINSFYCVHLIITGMYWSPLNNFKSFRKFFLLSTMTFMGWFLYCLSHTASTCFMISIYIFFTVRKFQSWFSLLHHI